MTSFSARAALLRQMLSSDDHRPSYHFLPPHNWMNDPNGLIQWQGKYHLFYQYNPTAPVWGNIHWGHAVSDDLVHWGDLPLALIPTPDGCDKDGCWSGVAVDNDGIPTLLYTGVFPEVQCLATSTDELYTWQKHRANPVIAAPPAHLDVLGFRDPCVWREHNTWYMTVGTGLRGIGGAVLLYRSPDLISWEYVSVLMTGEGAETGEVWECPAFFPLGDKHVLLISILPRAGTLYYVGRFDGEHFSADYRGILDYGLYFYAPQTLLDQTGRRIMLGWIWEGRSEEAQKAAGWAGIQSLPRQLTLRDDGYLTIEPVQELQRLRGRHIHQNEVTIQSDKGFDLGLCGKALEIIIELGADTSAVLGLKLFCSPDGEEQTILLLDPKTGEIVVDRSRSSITTTSDTEKQVGQVEPLTCGKYELHVFLDQSVIEMFVNRQCCLTSRVYPSRSDSEQVHLFTIEGDVTLKAIDIWELSSVW